MSAPLDRPNVARAGWIMMASLLLSRVLGTVRDIVAAAMFGQNQATDAYRISFQVPDLIFFLVAGGALSSAFIPVFSEYLHTDREDEAWHVFSAVTTVMAAVLVVVIGLAWVFAPQLSAAVSGGKPGDIVPLVTHMSRIVLPAQFAFFIGGLMFGTLYARQVFAVPGLGPNVYNIGIIAGALALGHVLQPGVVGMSWGAMVGNLLIPAWVLRRMGVRFRLTFDTRHPGVRKVFRLMVPVVLGLSLPGVYALILQYYSTFYAAGVNTAMDSANRLMQAPLGVFGQSLALAAFPALSQFRAQGRMDAFRDQLASSLKTVIYLSVPVSALLVAMPDAVVRVLLEHGRFTTADTARTGPALAMFAVGVAAWCLHPLLMRAYFSLQQNVRPIVMGTVATGVFVAMCQWVVGQGYGYPGLALAGSVTATLLVAAMLVDVRRATEGLDVRSVVSTLFQCALCSAPPAFAAGWLVNVWSDAGPGKVGFIAGTVGIGLVAVWGYIWLTRLLKMPEAATVERALKRLERRKPDQP
jgi:putative peptidoglycan lipid II flippase